MPISFITSNENKFREIQTVIPDLTMVDLDLPEIQSNDAHEIIRAKLQEALRQHPGAFIVEDTSLYVEALNGLPGPLIKWFLKSLGREGLAALVLKYPNHTAIAKTIIGYAKNPDEIVYFEGVIEGRIVTPRSDAGFGWDAIFEPAGYDKTFAEMGVEEKNRISMRKQAATQLAAYVQV